MTFAEFSAYSSGVRERDRVQWNHTAAVMCLHANLNRDPRRKAQAYEPDDFNPYAGENKPTTQRQLTPEDFKTLLSWRDSLSSA